MNIKFCQIQGTSQTADLTGSDIYGRDIYGRDIYEEHRQGWEGVFDKFAVDLKTYR